MRKYIVVDKREGETPLMALERARADASLGSVPLTYAGRLDPMASGKLLVLIGDECKKREGYDGLDKEYEFEVLFGASSDTSDILGLGQVKDRGFSTDAARLQAVVSGLRGKIEMKYPVFSARTVQGKALFEHALEGNIDDIEVPSRSVNIYDIKLLGTRTVSAEELLENVRARLALLKVDADSTNPYKHFRRDEILARWESELVPGGRFVVARFKVVASSGMYVRILAPLIAERAGTAGLAYAIKRTMIGKYSSVLALGFWRRKF